MNWRRYLICFAILSAVTFCTGIAYPADEAKVAAEEDVRQMQGEWIVASSERDGRPAPANEIASIRRKVTGDKVEIELAGQEGIVTLTSQFTLDAAADPKTIDVVRQDGPSAGAATLGIYEFQEGNLRICAGPPGQPRPTSFAAPAGSGLTLTVWKRAEPLAENSNRELEPRALEVLKSVSEYIKAAESWQTSATLTTTVREGDSSQRFEVSAQIAARRPGQFALRSQVAGFDPSGLVFVADGERLTTLINDRREYVQREGKTSLNGVGESLLSLGHVNTGVLFANLLSDDAYQTLLGGVTRCVYAGIERLEDAPYHVLRFKQEQMAWELWVAAEGAPLVRKLVSRGSHPAGADRPSVVTIEEYRDWRIDDALPADAFRFTPPADAKRVERLTPAG